MKKNKFSTKTHSPISILIFMMLLIATWACGNSPEVITDTPVSSGETSEPTEEPATEIANENPPKPVFCEIPPPTELGLGEIFDGKIEDPTWEKCFWVVIPEGLSKAEIKLGGLSDDLNLAVGYGFPITMQYHIGEFYRSAEKGTQDELVVLDNPAPGPYYIKVGIAGPRNPSTYSLSIVTDPEMNRPATGQALPLPDTCAFPAIEVNIGSTIESEIIGSDQRPFPRQYFCVQVPDGTDSLIISLSGLEGDLDLTVRHTTPSEWADLSRGGSERKVIIENPEEGSYYIDVVSAYSNAGSKFTLGINNP